MSVSVNLDEIVWQVRVAREVDQEEIFKFILDLDEAMADLHFTERLYAALGDEIRRELEADADQR